MILCLSSVTNTSFVSHIFQISCSFFFLDGYVGNVKKRRSQVRDVRDRNILSLYTKLHQLVGLLADLLQIQTLTDTAVLQLSTLGVAPFFVENVSELQLSALRLVTKVMTSELPRAFLSILLCYSNNLLSQLYFLATICSFDEAGICVNLCKILRSSWRRWLVKYMLENQNKRTFWFGVQCSFRRNFIVMICLETVFRVYILY